MQARLEGIQRSYRALTERLGDPDVIADANLLRKVMSDRSQMEEIVQVYEEYMRLKENWMGAKELFLEAEDGDAEMKEMARSEMKAIEPQLEELEKKITVLMLPKDPNDSRNVMLEIRAGTGGSEANIFAGKYHIKPSYRSFCTLHVQKLFTIVMFLRRFVGRVSQIHHCQRLAGVDHRLFPRRRWWLQKRGVGGTRGHGILQVEVGSWCSSRTASTSHRVARPRSHLDCHRSYHAGMR